MSWSFADARRAAAEVHAAELGQQAAGTARPRGVVGLVRSRAPLPLLLYVAARDGLVVEQDSGGFAVLQPPLVDGPNRSGGYGRWMLRALDRHWDMVVFATPPALSVGVAAATVPFPTTRLGGVVAVLLGVVWIAAVMTATLVHQFGWMSRMGAPSTRKHSRTAESLPGYHWSVPLVHQPDPDRVDELVRLMTDRLRHLVLAKAQDSVRGKASISGRVTEMLVVLTGGITTQRTHTALADSLHASRDHPNDGGTIVLDGPSKMKKAPEWPISGGRFLFLYILGIAVAIAACARFVADYESDACETSCTGQPATYDVALKWLLHRLYFSDGSILPLTTRATIIGLLVSVIALMGVLVATVAIRQELLRNRQNIEQHKGTLTDMTKRACTLILVVTEKERDAVLNAVQERTNKAATPIQDGSRTAFLLGSVGNTRVLLAQSGEQGIAAAAGMLVSALRLIEHLDPDYVILTGICYGLRRDEGQQIGDIIVGRRVQGVDHRKVTETGIIHRGVNVGCSPVLLDRFQAAQVTWAGSRVHIGTILTSNTLVNSTALVKELRSQFPDAIAGEMEGIGVAEATMEEFKPDWIVVKAISDWGYDKTDDRQIEAAHNVAKFLVGVLASGALSRRRADRQPSPT